MKKIGVVYLKYTFIWMQCFIINLTGGIQIENVLRKVCWREYFNVKRQEITRRCREMHYGEIHTFYP